MPHSRLPVVYTQLRSPTRLATPSLPCHHLCSMLPHLGLHHIQAHNLLAHIPGPLPPPLPPGELHRHGLECLLRAAERMEPRAVLGGLTGMAGAWFGAGAVGPAGGPAGEWRRRHAVVMALSQAVGACKQVRGELGRRQCACGSLPVHLSIILAKGFYGHAVLRFDLLANPITGTQLGPATNTCTLIVTPRTPRPDMCYKLSRVATPRSLCTSPVHLPRAGLANSMAARPPDTQPCPTPQ